MFFDGLDDGRYAQFKTKIHNNMIVGTITKLDTINHVYKIASQWVKTNAVHKSGSGTNYVITGLDHVEETRHENQLGDGGNPTNGEKKLPKKYREVECFTCKKKGHCANKLPNHKQAREEAARVALAAESDDEEIHTLQHGSQFNIILCILFTMRSTAATMASSNQMRSS